MSALLSPTPVMRFYDNNNNPLAGGQLWTYQAGTTTPVATYTDSTASTQNTNPIILNARGEAPVWLSPVQAYKFVLQDANGNTIWTADQITSPAPVAVGNMTDEKGSGGQVGFVAGVDFTAGVSTTLTLSQNYGSASNLWIAFDAAEQGADTYSLSGTTLTFSSPIPLGTSKVYVKGGTSLSIGTPGAGTVVDATVAANAAVQSSKLSYQNPATGGGSRTVLSKLTDFVSVMDFQAKGDGTTDDTNAFQNALNSLGAKGGRVLAPAGYNFLINGSLTLPINCQLVGPYEFTGVPGNNSSTPYANQGAILLNPTQTITLDSNAALQGLLIYPKGMTFPQTTYTGWSGTAVTINGDDVTISQCMIIGFNQAVYSTGNQRPRIFGLYHDNVQGIWIDNCKDVNHIRDCHAWPFATISASGGVLTRPGIAYKCTTENDTFMWVNNFAYGYQTCFAATNAVGGTMLNCSADGVVQTGFYGFNLTNCTNTNLIGCQGAAQDSAVAINNGVISYLHCAIIGCAFWGNINNAILINSGDVLVSGNHIRGSINGVAVNDNTSIVRVNGNRFQTISGSPVACFVASNTVYVGADNDFGDFPNGSYPANSNLQAPNFSSATQLNLLANEDTYLITGGTTISGIAGGWSRRVITLLFTNSCTIGSGGSSPNGISLSGGAAFNAVNGSVLTLRYINGLWYEIGRKAS